MKNISDKALTIGENQRLLGCLKVLSKGDGMVHPDITLHLNELRKESESLSLRQCMRSQVLINSDSQIIHAVAFGTAYILKVDHCPESKRKRIIEWSDGTTLNLNSEFGSDWIHGSFDPEEINWISKT